jgi:hypothetical protein
VVVAIVGTGSVVVAVADAVMEVAAAAVLFLQLRHQKLHRRLLASLSFAQ